MKLLLFSQQYRAATSGLGTYARTLGAGLAANGHDVTMAVPGSELEETPGVRMVPMDFRPGNLTPFAFFRMAREYRRVLDLEAKGGFDVIHFLDAREAALVRDIEAPAVGSVHDTYAVDYEGDPEAPVRERTAARLYYAWLRRLEPRAYGRLARLLANSDHVAGIVRESYGVPADRVRVIRLGLPPAPPAPPERLPGAPAVLFVGGNFGRKGLSVLLRGLARASARVPGIALTVVGGDRRAPRFAALARTLGIADRVEFRGHVMNDRVRALMSGADIFAMPSAVEAFGLVYLEAMRAGTPVIATRFGGASEAFADGREILLVDPRREEEVAEALVRIATDPALREALVAGGRAAADRLTAPTTVNATVAEYGEVGRRSI